jgi:hypothetical protein
MITNRICCVVIISSFVLAGSLNAAPNAAGVDASKPITAKQWALAGDGIGAWTICDWLSLEDPKRPAPSPEYFDGLYRISIRPEEVDREVESFLGLAPGILHAL